MKTLHKETTFVFRLPKIHTSHCTFIGYNFYKYAAMPSILFATWYFYFVFMIMIYGHGTGEIGRWNSLLTVECWLLLTSSAKSIIELDVHCAFYSVKVYQIMHTYMHPTCIYIAYANM